MKELNDYMLFLRKEYDKLCSTNDTTIKQKSYRNVCKDMFDGLTYGLSKNKLEKLAFTIENYRIEKQKFNVISLEHDKQMTGKEFIKKIKNKMGSIVNLNLKGK
jgi:hypothetical protein